MWFGCKQTAMTYTDSIVFVGSELYSRRTIRQTYTRVVVGVRIAEMERGDGERRSSLIIAFCLALFVSPRNAIAR